MRVRPFLAAALAGSAALSAQSLKPGLALIPASVESVEIYRQPSDFTARWRAFTATFGEPGDLMNLPSRTGIAVGDLAPGAVVIGQYNRPAPAPDAEGNLVPQPTPFLAALPVADAKALLARLKAQEQAGVWTYALKDAKGDADRFAAIREGFLLVSNDRAKLLAALAAKDRIGQEVDAAAEGWLTSHDAAIFVSGQETRSDLASLVKGVDSPKASGLTSTRPRLKELAVKAQGSITHFFVGLDLDKDGSARGAFRASFAPGSPLSKDAAGLAPLGAHPLAGLPQQAFALACGGQWPEALNVFASDPDLAFAPFKGHDLPAKLKADYLAALKAQSAQVQSLSFLLGSDLAEGQALLQGAVMVLHVKDDAAYEKGAEKVVELQAQLAKAAEKDPWTTIQKDLIPGTASFGLTTDLSLASGGPMPPQGAMVTSFLFGGTVMHQGLARMAPRTWIAVFGRTEDLKQALARAKDGAEFRDEPMLRREDALLPIESRFNLYLDLKGLRDLGQRVMGALSQGSAPLPEVAHLPPFGVAFTSDATGFEVRGAARPETLKAMKDLVAAIQKSLPSKTPPPPAEPTEPSH